MSELASELRALCADECRNRIDYRCVVCRGADDVERLAAAEDLIVHLRISEAGWINENKKEKERLADAEAFVVKHRCQTCDGVRVCESDLCSCEEAAKGGRDEHFL